MNTSTRKLRKAEWGTYFDAVSKTLGATKVNVVVLGLDLGAQHEAERVLLEGISYDSHDDTLDIITERFDHRIAHPWAIFVQEDATGRLMSCEIKDGEGHDQIVQLHPSLQLSAS